MWNLLIPFKISKFRNPNSAFFCVCMCAWHLGTEDDFGGLVSANLILLRNRLLDILLKLLYTSKEKTTVNLQ